MQTISFYSYKGGTGRSLVVANVARYLARFGQKVVVLDFDLEAPGLHHKFNLGIDDDRILNIKQGVVDYIHSFSTEGKAPASIKKFATSVPISRDQKESIHLIAAGTAPSSEYWKKLSQIKWHDLLYRPNGAGIEFFLEMKEKVEKEFKPDFFLIDSRTGITEIGGIATTILPEKLVSLMLTNIENLEGTRAVLRSLRSAPRLEGTQPPEIIPVLSRIPKDIRESSDEKDEEQKITQKVLDFLNEKAEVLEDTLNLTEITVLHSEPDLQINERLLVGGDKSPDDSTLLRDYFRLFDKMISLKIFRPYIGELADKAKLAAFEDPEGAQKELESLTLTGHPDAYRELLKFYRLRNKSGNIVLKTAARLYDITQDAADPILKNVVESNFEEVNSYSEGHKERYSQLPFVEAVWRAAGTANVKIGCDLANSYDNFEQTQHAATLLLNLVENVGANEKAVVLCLKMLIKDERLKSAKKIIERFRKELSDSSKFLEVWADYAIYQSDDQSINTLTTSPFINSLIASSPTSAYGLMKKAKQEMKAERFLKMIVLRAHKQGKRSDLIEIGMSLNEMGYWKEFEHAIPNVLSPAEKRDIMRRIHGG